MGLGVTGAPALFVFVSWGWVVLWLDRFCGGFEEGKSCRFAFGFTPAFGREVARFARGFAARLKSGPSGEWLGAGSAGRTADSTIMPTKLTSHTYAKWLIKSDCAL